MRRLLGILTLVVGGCSYPSFEFSSETGAVDTSPGETPSTADTRVDTGDVDTAAPLDSEIPVCSTSGAFCETWDDATTPTAKFRATIVDIGTLSLTAGRSSTKALQSSVGQTDAGSASAYLTQPFDVPTNAAPIRVDLWMKLDSATYPSATGNSTLFKIEHLGPGAIGDGLAFAYAGGGLYADLYATKYGHYPLGFAPVADEWFHVRIDIAVHTSKGSLTVWINDMAMPLVSASGISTATADSLQRNIVIGQYATSPNGTFRVSYDDLAVSLR